MTLYIIYFLLYFLDFFVFWLTDSFTCNLRWVLSSPLLIRLDIEFQVLPFFELITIEPNRCWLFELWTRPYMRRRTFLTPDQGNVALDFNQIFKSYFTYQSWLKDKQTKTSLFSAHLVTIEIFTWNFRVIIHKKILCFNYKKLIKPVIYIVYCLEIYRYLKKQQGTLEKIWGKKWRT